MSDQTGGQPTPQPAGRTRHLFAAVAESSDDAIIGKDLNGTVISWNGVAEAMFGYTRQEIVGQPITLIVPPDLCEEEATLVCRVYHGEKISHFVTTRLRKDGERVAVSITLAPIHDDAGHITGVAKIARDITAMQQAEDELHRREALLHSILDTVPDALIIIDARGLVQSFSAAAERLFGFTAAEVIGRNISHLMPTPYREGHDGYLHRYQETGERRIIGIGRIVVGQRRDGSTFPMELSVGEVDHAGTRLFTGFVRDLTERQERERRLNELQSELVHVSRLTELGQMAAALAHEVNQPLTAMANYLNGVRRLLAAGRQDSALQAMDRIAEQAERARQLIQRLRAMVRKGETEQRPEDLAKIIEEASALALVGVGSALKLEIHVAPDAAAGVIDKIQIQQVLLNLMRNAAEAMAGQAHRALTVSTARLGDRVEISVGDNGPGLPETVRTRLFQPFVTTKPSGMGVGLSVCRTIVEAHGGELRAEDLPGGGTVFRLTVARPPDAVD